MSTTRRRRSGRANLRRRGLPRVAGAEFAVCGKWPRSARKATGSLAETVAAVTGSRSAVPRKCDRGSAALIQQAGAAGLPRRDLAPVTHRGGLAGADDAGSPRPSPVGCWYRNDPQFIQTGCGFGQTGSADSAVGGGGAACTGWTGVAAAPPRPRGPVVLGPYRAAGGYEMLRRRRLNLGPQGRHPRGPRRQADGPAGGVPTHIKWDASLPPGPSKYGWATTDESAPARSRTRVLMEAHRTRRRGG